MLKIFNELEPFFKNNYQRINVREYGRIVNISAPSASKKLEELHNYGLLRKEIDRNYIFYSANNDHLFIQLSQAYWRFKFKQSGLIKQLNQELVNPIIILYGSFAKAEITRNSDIDLAIFSVSKKKLNLDKFEKKLKRNIHPFLFTYQSSVKNKELLNNIMNGVILSGGW